MQEERWNAFVMMSSSASHRTATLNGHWKMGKEGVAWTLGTDVDYQQVKLKVEACLDSAAPDSAFETTLCFYSSPPLEESVCRRGVLKAAPVKAAIITPRG